MVQVNKCEVFMVKICRLPNKDGECFKMTTETGSWFWASEHNHFRLATSNEIDAYLRGCRHIDDFNQYKRFVFYLTHGML